MCSSYALYSGSYQACPNQCPLPFSLSCTTPVFVSGFRPLLNLALCNFTSFHRQRPAVQQCIATRTIPDPCSRARKLSLRRSTPLLLLLLGCKLLLSSPRRRRQLGRDVLVTDAAGHLLRLAAQLWLVPIGGLHISQKSRRLPECAMGAQNPGTLLLGITAQEIHGRRHAGRRLDRMQPHLAELVGMVEARVCDAVVERQLQPLLSLLQLQQVVRHALGSGQGWWCRSKGQLASARNSTQRQPLCDCLRAGMQVVCAELR